MLLKDLGSAVPSNLSIAMAVCIIYACTNYI